MSAPLLACEAARIDVGGAPLLDRLSCTSTGQRLGLIGAWAPLFALLGREASLAAGRVEIAGTRAGDATARGVVGLARTAAPLPADWTIARWLEHSARLAGVARGAARDEAFRAARALGLEALLPRRIGALAPWQRRAAIVAHAVLGGPPAVAVEAPLDGLDDASQRALADAIDRAATERALVVSAGFVAPTGAARGLFDRLDEVFVLEAGNLVAEGPPGHALAPGRRYLVSVSRQAAALAAALADRGVAVAPATPADRARFVVDLAGEFGPDALVALALDLEAPLVELVPLAPGAAPAAG